MKLYEFKNEKTNQTIYFQDFLNTGTKPYFNYLNNNIKSFLENNENGIVFMENFGGVNFNDFSYKSYINTYKLLLILRDLNNYKSNKILDFNPLPHIVDINKMYDLFSDVLKTEIQDNSIIFNGVDLNKVISVDANYNELTSSVINLLDDNKNTEDKILIDRILYIIEKNMTPFSNQDTEKKFINFFKNLEKSDGDFLEKEKKLKLFLNKQIEEDELLGKSYKAYEAFNKKTKKKFSKFMTKQAIKFVANKVFNDDDFDIENLKKGYNKTALSVFEILTKLEKSKKIINELEKNLSNNKNIFIIYNKYQIDFVKPYLLENGFTLDEKNIKSFRHKF